MFVRKFYNNMKLFLNAIIYVTLNKFAFRAFNYLAYNQEINSLLVVSYLLRLSDYYTLSDNLKSQSFRNTFQILYYIFTKPN